MPCSGHIAPAVALASYFSAVAPATAFSTSSSSPFARNAAAGNLRKISENFQGCGPTKMHLQWRTTAATNTWGAQHTTAVPMRLQQQQASIQTPVPCAVVVVVAVIRLVLGCAIHCCHVRWQGWRLTAFLPASLPATLRHGSLNVSLFCGCVSVYDYRSCISVATRTNTYRHTHTRALTHATHNAYMQVGVCHNSCVQCCNVNGSD